MPALMSDSCRPPTASRGGPTWKERAGSWRWAQRLGIARLHHVSTAYVRGTRTGTIHENDLDCGQEFHNEYERSKFAAECLLHQPGGILATIYRPSVIVGDSRTGFTSSYQGIYHFLALGDRLARATADGRRRLEIRLPFTGDEPRNLVPVDWVAGAIRRIIGDSRLHGRSYHLVARRPIAARLLSDVAADVLGIDGYTWAGAAGVSNPSSLERLVLEAIAAYRPYWNGDPTFRADNLCRALPDFPPPAIDRDLLVRLLRFAVADCWGRGPSRPRLNAGVDCAHYLEHFFPSAVRRSSLAGVPLDVSVALDIHGPGGGQWSCYWLREELRRVTRGLAEEADVLYRLDVPTFVSITAGRVSVQEAFFNRQVEVVGDVEKGLKLAVLFSQFVREHPYPPGQHEETADAVEIT